MASGEVKGHCVLLAYPVGQGIHVEKWIKVKWKTSYGPLGGIFASEQRKTAIDVATALIAQGFASEGIKDMGSVASVGLVCNLIRELAKSGDTKLELGQRLLQSIIS